MDLNHALEIAVNKFKNVNGFIKIVSHLDADGISSAAILSKALKREGKLFSLSIVKQADKKILKEISNESFDCIIFSDLGSGYLDEIYDIFKDKLIFIFDHHIVEGSERDNIVHINSLLFEYDYNDVCGAGLCYLFAKKLDEDNKDLAYLGILGAVGDSQEFNGFRELNELILKDAIDSGKLEIKKGLRMFGYQTKPLHKVLQYSTDPYIPGVSGDEIGAINFINGLGIEMKKGEKLRTLSDLKEEETKRLVTAIVLRRLDSEKNPEDVLGFNYLLKDEPLDSPTREVREFCTLLNSCGRLNRASLGIGTCLGNKVVREQAISLLGDYKKELINVLKWFYENRNTEHIIEGKGYVIINGRDFIKDTLIGTLASIISKSNIYTGGTKILALTHTFDGNIKISFRVSGLDEEVNLRDCLKDIMSVMGENFEWGGHESACGGLIPQEKEVLFIKTAMEKLKNS